MACIISYHLFLGDLALLTQSGNPFLNSGFSVLWLAGIQALNMVGCLSGCCARWCAGKGIPGRQRGSSAISSCHSTHSRGATAGAPVSQPFEKCTSLCCMVSYHWMGISFPPSLSSHLGKGAQHLVGC